MYTGAMLLECVKSRLDDSLFAQANIINMFGFH